MGRLVAFAVLNLLVSRRCFAWIPLANQRPIGFRSAALSSSKSWVDEVVADTWISESMQAVAASEEAPRTAVVGPDHVLVYDTTLRGTSSMLGA